MEAIKIIGIIQDERVIIITTEGGQTIIPIITELSKYGKIKKIEELPAKEGTGGFYIKYSKESEAKDATMEVKKLINEKKEKAEPNKVETKIEESKKYLKFIRVIKTQNQLDILLYKPIEMILIKDLLNQFGENIVRINSFPAEKLDITKGWIKVIYKTENEATNAAEFIINKIRMKETYPTMPNVEVKQGYENVRLLIKIPPGVSEQRVLKRLQAYGPLDMVNFETKQYTNPIRSVTIAYVTYCNEEGKKKAMEGLKSHNPLSIGLLKRQTTRMRHAPCGHSIFASDKANHEKICRKMGNNSMENPLDSTNQPNKAILNAMAQLNINEEKQEEENYADVIIEEEEEASNETQLALEWYKDEEEQ